MIWAIAVSNRAQGNLKRVPVADRERILAALDAMRIDPLSGDVVKLAGHDAFRRRVGHYRIVLPIIFGIAFLLAMTFAAWADIRIDRKEFSIDVWITGAITEHDARALQEISREMERRPFRVWLHSEGGDVSAALQIGRLVRKYEGATFISVPSKCYSSCALIFIAGVSRNNFGEIGLHRPYFASAPQSRQSVESKFPLMLSMVKSYVAEMGITDNFYQQMVNTEPSQMVTYGWSDYKWLVPEFDPLYAEVEISYEAREHGVSTSEMRQRNQDADECYKLSDSLLWLTCVEAKKWSLSERVYRERKEKVTVCAPLDDETKILNAIPKKERRDHPIAIRAETCQRNVMLRP